MPTSTYTPIATYTNVSSASGYTFSSIPSIYTDLELVVTGIGTNSGAGDYIKMRVGNASVDTGTNYSYIDFYASDWSGNMGAGGEANKDFMYVNGFGNMMHGGNAAPMGAKICFFDYSNTSTNKRILVKNFGVRNGGSQNPVSEMLALSWRSTAAINTIQLYTGTYSFAAGATFTLYGIKAGS